MQTITPAYSIEEVVFTLETGEHTTKQQWTVKDICSRRLPYADIVYPIYTLKGSATGQTIK